MNGSGGGPPVALPRGGHAHCTHGWDPARATAEPKQICAGGRCRSLRAAEFLAEQKIRAATVTTLNTVLNPADAQLLQMHDP